jgi:RNA polymerase sigma-70 factor (ECF subfamily)
MAGNNMQKSDKEILELVREDLHYFSMFYEKYFDKIYKYCNVKLNFQKEETEDAVSKVFLKAVEHIQEFDLNEGKTSILPWLYTIARNTVYDTWRAKGRAGKIRLDDEDLNKEHAGFMKDPSSSMKKIEENIDKEAGVKEVKEAMKVLNEKTSEIIYLKIEHEMTFVEIAAELEISESAAKMRYYRGLKKVTKELDKQL